MVHVKYKIFLSDLGYSLNKTTIATSSIINWEAWLPRISHKTCGCTLLLWGVQFSFLLNLRLSNSQSRREVRISCYAFLSEVGILSDQFSWVEEALKCLVAIVEDLMSNKTPGNFARTFRDDEKVFILQLGSNSHGSFLMISELIHGCRKGFLMVPEGKAGSGWRGFGFHLRKAIAPETLATKQPFNSVLKPIVENHKTFLRAAAEGDRRDRKSVV